MNIMIKAPLAAENLVLRLEAEFGTGRAWKSRHGFVATVWETPAYHLLYTDGGSETDLRRLWEDHKGRSAYAVVLLAAAADDPSRLRVSGPQDARPVRELPAERVLDLLKKCRDYPVREAAAFLSGEFNRLTEAAVPGVRVKDLLTPHFVRERLRRPVDERLLTGAVEDIGAADGRQWRSLFENFGYQVKQLQRRGYLLRHRHAPVAVVHPHRSPAQFSRLTANGELPEGLVLADCDQRGASWGVLASGGRYRLFQRRPSVGAATGQYLELDAGELESNNRLYLGLLAPESLAEGGWLTRWIAEAKDFGEELRQGLEERLIKDALPNIARGLGEYLRSQGTDLADRRQLRQIEKAALTLVFRFMFLLHVEARGHLPIGSAAYRPHSAIHLAEDSRLALSDLDARSTQRWDRLRTLVRMVRTGDRSCGVPVYNGSLFAADGFPGSALLERAEVADVYLAPALAAIAFETLTPGQPGLDYAGLQIGHLGAIYEALLTLRLTQATEDLAYDARRDVFRPVRDDEEEEPEVSRAQLFYQAEKGGRKARGVFYTRREFVNHLLLYSLRPALDEHLREVEQIAQWNSDEAARRLLDFSVIDPAMGSAHFLTAALDMMADRIELFLAEVGGLPAIARSLNELSEETAISGARPEDGDLLRRLILKRCIYGVDLSPMAVEVANVTLWLASFVPGLALSYLGSNLKCGDALIGVADPAVVGAEDSPLLTGEAVDAAMRRAAGLQRELAVNPDRTPDEVKRSEELNAGLRDATAGLRRAFDLWTAEPLGVPGARHVLETNGAEIVEGDNLPAAEISDRIKKTESAARRYRFFHWPLEFPHVFHRGRPGFDMVVGNPPWNKVKLEELAFYALRDPGLRGLPNLAARRRRIAELDRQNPIWRRKFEAKKAQLAKPRAFFTKAGGYQLQDVGDKDLYQLFCERYSHLVRREGQLGVVLPRTAFQAKGAKRFRLWLFEHTTVTRIDSILNKRRWAFDIHPQYSVVLLAGSHEATSADAVFQVTGPSASFKEFEAATSGLGVSLPVSSLGSARVVPLVPSQMHADVLAKMRRGVQFADLSRPLGASETAHAAASRATPHRELDETQQRALFSYPKGELRLPVWKGRCFGQYNPQGREPAGYCDWQETLDFVHTKRSRSPIFKRIFSANTLSDPGTHPIHRCRIAYHAVANRTDSRTVIACLVPPRTPLTNAAPYLIFTGWDAVTRSSLLGVMNSAPFDWLARRYVERNLNFHTLNMLCLPPPEDTPWRRIGELAARLSCLDERFAEFAAEAGVEWGPLTEAERSEMRAEIDALTARGYGLTADELRFVFTDFTENAISLVYRERVMGKFESL